ncbi:alpha-agglutinin [Kluyveromyces marxianus DMKU3-1042]|uniref:Alpha-agglutinin n=1 Tax=Kluyveromyces marxianus (strain DMKU3-1042 / BCC 29191 / NBRC 104275) TaxID=1003335 RepID=W0TGA4_KLUMD|nr:alpha-agglutinin [Kluyveromyces marxianus DMKU3-1042]BAO42380.2 alpha-agglutinin [Kluyveromyces marxianus DMKU3-1042]
MVTLSLLQTLAFVSFVSVTSAKDVTSNIKLSNPSVVAAPGSNSFPHQGWVATLDWSVDDTSNVKAKDYFSISMPHVYKVKFNDGDTSFNVTLDNNENVFECYAPQQAAYKYDSTTLQCYALTDFSSYKSLSGSLKTTLVLSDGGSAYTPEINNAKYFSAGEGKISFNDLEASINLDAYPETNDFYFSGRSTAYGSLESYFLGFKCPNGYVLGAKQQIQYDINNKGYGIDCSSVQVYQSKNYNDWLFPTDYENLDGTVSCGDNELEITVNKLEPEYRVWVNALQSLDSDVATVRNSVYYDYTCTNTLQNSTYTTSTHYVPVYIITEAVYTGEAITTLAPQSQVSTLTTSTDVSTFEFDYEYKYDYEF